MFFSAELPAKRLARYHGFVPTRVVWQRVHLREATAQTGREDV